MPYAPPKQCQYPGCNNSVFKRVRYCDDCKKRNTRVYLVIGPSGSGKSTYVREHAQTGDLILDFDLIYKAISNCQLYDKPTPLLGYVLAARQTMINMIGLVDNVRAAWIIRNKITKYEISAMKNDLGAEVIELRVDADECKRRLHNDPDRDTDELPRWYDRVDQWWIQHG